MNLNDLIREPRKYMIYLIGRIIVGSEKADAVYLKMLYKYRMGKTLDLNNPKTYNEKLQWLKIHNRKQLHNKMVDKYEVRKYITDKIGEEYLIPLFGIWDKFEDIEFDKLPEQFVLKCTHDSSSLIICKDKMKLDLEEVRKKINHYLKRNYYYNTREWPYKDVKPRIIAEKYMVDESGVELKDYKFYCFNGEPKALLLISNRGLDTRGDFFDSEFNKIPVKRCYYKGSNKLMNKPLGFENMIEIARKLSEGFSHIRVDLYNVNGQIYFGELTFYCCSGLKKFVPEEYDLKFGDWLELS